MNEKTKEEIKKEIKEEINESVKVEVKTELKSEMKDELKEGMKNEIKNELREDTSEGTHKNVHEDIRRGTMYVEGSGLFQFVKGDLSKEEALLIQGKVNNGEYGKSTHWYRKVDNKGIYSVWQRILDMYNLSSDEIAACKATSMYVIPQENEKDISEITEEIKKSVSNIEILVEYVPTQISVLYGLVGGLYFIGIMSYLHYIVKANNTIMALCFICIIAAITSILWFNCEMKRCNI